MEKNVVYRSPFLVSSRPFTTLIVYDNKSTYYITSAYRELFMYMMLKHSHMLIAFLTIAIFIIRGAYMLRGSSALNNKFFKIAPHILYTLLLATGIGLAINLSFKLGDHFWLQAKLAYLIAFIALAIFTFKLHSK